MNSIASIVNIGDTVWKLEKTNDTIIISSDFQKRKVLLGVFFQLSAVCLHAFEELEYVKINYPGISLILRKDHVGDISVTIKYDGINKIEIIVDDLTMYINQQQFALMVNDLYNAINNFVAWSSFNAHNYDPAFLNVMLAKELPYIYGEKIVDMYLGELVVPHVPYQHGGPETVSLEECVRVNSLRGNVDIDSFNRRESNHYNQSNSKRLNSVLDMVINQGYPYNNEYITIFNTDNLVVDGWHRASCLYYLYGNISVPVKMILLNKQKESAFCHVDMN